MFFFLKNLKDWEEISKIISIFTPIQCKYSFLSLKKSNIQKSDWNNEEDHLLIQMINSGSFGKKDKFKWTKIAQEFNRNLNIEKNFRLAKHCRERFYNHLNPALKKGDWTISEDVILLRNYLRFHKKWSKINGKFEGRNDNIVKNRFYKLMNTYGFMEKNRRTFTDEKIKELIDNLENFSKDEEIKENMEKFNENEEKINENKEKIDENEERIEEKFKENEKNLEKIERNIVKTQVFCDDNSSFFLPEHNYEMAKTQNIDRYNQNFVKNNRVFSYKEIDEASFLEQIFKEIQKINIYKRKSFNFVKTMIKIIYLLNFSVYGPCSIQLRNEISLSKMSIKDYILILVSIKSIF